VALVPWLLDSSELLYGRRSRPLPGQDRRGEPVRPPLRRSPTGVFRHDDDRAARATQRNSLQPHGPVTDAGSAGDAGSGSSRRATRPAGPAEGVDPALVTAELRALVPPSPAAPRHDADA